MFCDEKILAVYTSCGPKYDLDDGEDLFFDCYHDLALHITEGVRIVLETENYYLALESSGVKKHAKTLLPSEFARDTAYFEPLIDTENEATMWVDYETTLFVGERLREVEALPERFLLHFDDFELKIVPHTLGDNAFPHLDKKDHWSYNRVFGAERHLKATCPCGGSGELLMDFVGDYGVRCKQCKKSTYAYMNAQDAIRDWNAGRIQCDLSDITVE